jgi:nitrite reductase/ring-hydroxylating ferredoxin subunit
MSDVVKSWVRMCSFDELKDGQAANININGQRLVVARCGDIVSVLQGFCSHMLFPLSGSRIDNCILMCNLHHSKFDIRDGSVVDWSTFPPLIGSALAAIREKKALRTYETSIDNGDVYILWPTEDPSTVRVKL